MDTATKTFAELSPLAQDLVSSGKGWNGTTYTDGTVTVTLHGEGEVAEYSVEGEVEAETETAEEIVDETPTVEETPETTEPVAPETGLESVPQGTDNGPVDPATVTGEKGTADDAETTEEVTTE